MHDRILVGMVVLRFLFIVYCSGFFVGAMYLVILEFKVFLSPIFFFMDFYVVKVHWNYHCDFLV